MASGRNGARYQHGNRKIDLFAEALSETGDIATAGNVIGVSYGYAKSMFRTVRRELGWQAR